MEKKGTSQQNLSYLRHSCSHLLAAAILHLWPDTKRAIGPSIENGFYYDFEFSKPISESDFSKIEQEMHRLAKDWKAFERKEVSKEEAKKAFADNPYKLELIEEFSANKEPLTLYGSGEYLDLCKGGHIEHPKDELKHFKLLSVAGAYWRGSEKNKMLTRIYGTCFPTKDELDHFLWQQEEARKRDHKKLGRDLDLFIISPEIGGGLPIFLPKGLVLRSLIEKFITHEKQKRGYQFVWSPHLAKSDVYKRSGHWQKYDAMYPPISLEDEDYVLKPMNCPHHFQVYLARPHSYRELPIRIAENGTVYRNEKSGELNGLLRVRAATIDDTHTLVRHDQIAEEIDNVLDLIHTVFTAFGFSNYKARISIRDPKNADKYLGLPKLWDEAEQSLIEAAKRRKIDYFIGEGEAAFYGPKIDFMVSDSLGREWQLSTNQLDFVQPENFDLSYTDEKGEKKRPAVLHIAILGSIERFMGILIEDCAGMFPLWLSPIQIAILPISEKQHDYAKNVHTFLQAAGFRTELDSTNETLGKRIRHWEMQKVPYVVILGEKEKIGELVAVRKHGQGDLGTMSQHDFLLKLKEDMSDKNRNVTPF